MECSIPLDYTWNIKVSSFDVGHDCQLKLSSQLKLQQESGELQFEKGKLGYEQLSHYGIAFVLTKAKSIIYRAPSLGEKVYLKTWHRGSKGVQFYRNYQYYDEKENLLIDSVTAFALVDTAEHKLLRPSVFNRFGVPEQMSRVGTCPDPGRWKLPDNMQLAGTRRIRWSDIDYNGHVNNAVYADIACDFIPGGMNGKKITECSINFLHEALLEDELVISTTSAQAEGENDAWISGMNQNNPCFEAHLHSVLVE